MTEISTYLALFVLACMAVFQIALIFGAPLGHFAWGGAHKILPAKLRVSSVVAVTLYVIFALFLLDKAGVIDILSSGVASVGTWVITVYLGTGVLLNGISRSKSERMVMTPATLVLTICFAIVALS